MQEWQRAANSLLRMFELGHIAGEFLAQGQGGSVLQMRAADLDDTGERISLDCKGRFERLKRRQDLLLKGPCRRDVHGSGKDIVRGLSEIDVVIRVNQTFRPTL